MLISLFTVLITKCFSVLYSPYPIQPSPQFPTRSGLPRLVPSCFGTDQKSFTEPRLLGKIVPSKMRTESTPIVDLSKASIGHDSKQWLVTLEAVKIPIRLGSVRAPALTC